MNRIQRKLDRFGTYHVYKISLSCFHDKRYILDDGVTYFHKDIRDCKNDKEFTRMIKNS